MGTGVGLEPAPEPEPGTATEDIATGVVMILWVRGWYDFGVYNMTEQARVDT